MPATPNPDLGLLLSKEIADTYGQAVDDLLRIVARRLARGIDQPGWAERKLIEMVALRNQARAVLDHLQGADVAGVVGQAWTAGVVEAAADLGLTLRPGIPAVDALTRELVGMLDGMRVGILRSVDDAYRAVVAEVSGQVTTGVLTRRQAAQRALDRFADRGITGFVDRAGRRWNMESYAEMATRTTVGRAQVQGALDQYRAAGRDLVIVSDSPGECSRCRPWEGQVLSISGALEFPSVAAATESGLLHANCRHVLTLFTPGLTRPMRNTADPEGDRNRQEQRRLERGVRHWKRREAVALDDRARARARAHVRQWQGRLREHVAEHDLKRLRYREQLGSI